MLNVQNKNVKMQKAKMFNLKKLSVKNSKANRRFYFNDLNYITFYTIYKNLLLKFSKN